MCIEKCVDRGLSEYWTIVAVLLHKIGYTELAQSKQCFSIVYSFWNDTIAYYQHNVYHNLYIFVKIILFLSLFYKNKMFTLRCTLCNKMFTNVLCETISLLEDISYYIEKQSSNCHGVPIKSTCTVCIDCFVIFWFLGRKNWNDDGVLF